MNSFEYDRELFEGFELLFTSGGDSRTCLDAKGRNKYYSASRPLYDTVMFGSCTSSSVSKEGYNAALGYYRQLNAIENLDLKKEAISEYYSLIRREFLNYIMKLDGYLAQAIFTPSGTDAEYIALWIAWLFSRKGSVSNIVIGPSELGSGTVMAASAKYFDTLTPSGENVEIGRALDSELSSNVYVHTVPIRDNLGKSYNITSINKKVSELVENEIELGRHVLLHLVAHSKTGIHAPSLETVYDLRKRFGKENLSIVIDAAQGRFSREGMFKVIQNGFMVIITGSKFFGGPGFCGALVVPKVFEESLKHETTIPRGFEKFFTADMFPSDWIGPRKALEKRSQSNDFQLGLLLRWRASLAEIVRYYHTPSKLRFIILKEFGNLVPKIVNQSTTVCLVSEFDKINKKVRVLQSNTTVFNIALKKCNKFLTREELSIIFLLLTLDLSAEVDNLSVDERRCLDYKFQIGQPVVLGKSNSTEVCVLRIAIGAVQISDLAIDIKLGRTLSQRLTHLEYQLVFLVKKLEILVKYFDELKGYTDNANK
jgi:hypothetical protein